MASSEDRFGKILWRALDRHIKAGHELEVRRMSADQNLEITCCWCGNTVLAGSPRMIRDLVKRLKDSGVPISDLAAPVLESLRFLQG
jgi:hypothetical protein